MATAAKTQKKVQKVQKVENFDMTLTVNETLDTLKNGVQKINDMALETTESVLESVIRRGAQWQDVAEKAVKGSNKLMDKQQDIVFATLETLKGQVVNGTERIKTLIGK